MPWRGKNELNSETISRLPAAALITAHRQLGGAIRKGVKESLIPSEDLTRVLEQLDLDQHIKTNSSGIASSKLLPNGTYTVKEITAPANYGLNPNTFTADLEFAG